MRTKLGLLTITLLLAAGTAHADFSYLAAWDNNGQAGNQAYTAPKTPGSVNISAGNMVRSSGLSGESISDSFSSKGFNNPGNFVQFGFSIATGYSANISELWIGTKSSATGPSTIGVFTSADNYTTAISTINKNGTNTTYSKINLSTLGLVSGTFNIRLKPTDIVGAESTFSVINYTAEDGNYPTAVTGNTATPLPAAAWLLGPGLLGLIGLRRKL